MNLSAQLESILFFRGETVAVPECAKMLGVSVKDIQEVAEELSDALASRGIRLVSANDTLALATAPEMSEKIATLVQEDLERDLGKAGLETLAVIAYRGPVTRADIEYIRGVNSSFTIRQLLMRGLIERTQNPTDARSFIYRPTVDLFRFLGITSTKELPQADAFAKQIKAFETEKENEISNP